LFSVSGRRHVEQKLHQQVRARLLVIHHDIFLPIHVRLQVRIGALTGTDGAEVVVGLVGKVDGRAADVDARGVALVDLGDQGRIGDVGGRRTAARLPLHHAVDQHRGDENRAPDRQITQVHSIASGRVDLPI
jgi:hypothetical protein